MIMKINHLKWLRLFLGLALFCAFVYAGFWIWLAAQIRDSAQDKILEIQSLPDSSVILRALDLSGFPGPPVLRFSGTVRTDRIQLHIPLLTLRGFFLPRTTLTLDLPEGYAVHATGKDVPQSLFLLQLSRLEIVLPRHIPERFSNADMQAWQAQGEAVQIQDFVLLRDDGLAVMGAGALGLDDGLEPDLRLRTTILRPELFLKTLTEAGVLTEGQESLARALLGALKGPDGALRTEFSVRNGGVYLGPVRLGDAPPMAWVQEAHSGTHNPPALPR